MSDCLFCRIVDGEVPADVVLRTDDIVAFRDIDPKAPIHVLVVPTLHAATLLDLVRTDAQAAARWLGSLADVAALLDLEAAGFRTVVNTGPDGGQTVDHLHAHLLGGRQMSWPPG
jgi:histidine triad (HIT) family protein